MVTLSENTEASMRAQCTATQRSNHKRTPKTSRTQIRHCMQAVQLGRARQISKSSINVIVRARGTEHGVNGDASSLINSGGAS